MLLCLMATKGHKNGNLDGNLPVKKANLLIESRYDLSAMEHRILGVILAQIVQESPEDLIYRFPLQEFCRFINIENDSHRFENLSRVLTKFRSRSFVINDTDENGKQVDIICGWVDTAKIERGKGWVKLRVNRDAFPYIKDLSGGFTSYEVKAILEMSSGFSARIFELLKQHEGEANAAGYWYHEIMLEDLKRYLNLEKKYARGFPDFRRKVLEKAINEINEKTRMEVNWEARRWGRKVGSIQFHCHMRSAQPKTRSLRSVKSATALREMYDAYVAKHAKKFEELEPEIQKRLLKSNAEKIAEMEKVIGELFNTPEGRTAYLDGLAREEFEKLEPFAQWAKQKRVVI